MSAANEGTPRTDAIVISGNAERFLSMCRMLERDLAAERAKREDLEVKYKDYLAAAFLDHDADVKDLQGKLAEFKRIGQGFERDSRTFFSQSCLNLQRAESAEARLKEARAVLYELLEVAELGHRVDTASNRSTRGFADAAADYNRRRPLAWAAARAIAAQEAG